MNILKNCPNCGGYLNNSGRCEFCGSKVYDFINVDFDAGGGYQSSKTYIRIKSNGKIITCPIIIQSTSITIKSHPCFFETYGNEPYTKINAVITEGTFDFFVDGDVLYENLEGEENETQ